LWGGKGGIKCLFNLESKISFFCFLGVYFLLQSLSYYKGGGIDQRGAGVEGGATLFVTLEVSRGKEGRRNRRKEGRV